MDIIFRWEINDTADSTGDPIDYFMVYKKNGVWIYQYQIAVCSCNFSHDTVEFFSLSDLINFGMDNEFRKIFYDSLFNKKECLPTEQW